MKKYIIVDPDGIESATEHIPQSETEWTEGQLIEAGFSPGDLASLVTLGKVFEITFLNPPE